MLLMYYITLKFSNDYSLYNTNLYRLYHKRATKRQEAIYKEYFRSCLLMQERHCDTYKYCLAYI